MDQRSRKKKQLGVVHPISSEKGEKDERGWRLYIRDTRLTSPWKQSLLK